MNIAALFWFCGGRAVGLLRTGARVLVAAAMLTREGLRLLAAAGRTAPPGVGTAGAVHMLSLRSIPRLGACRVGRFRYWRRARQWTALPVELAHDFATAQRRICVSKFPAPYWGAGQRDNETRGRADGKLTYLGHACLFLSNGRESLIFDPYITAIRGRRFGPAKH